MDVFQGGSTLTLSGNFHPDFTPRAENLGGEWIASRSVWEFEKEDQGDVLEVCKNLNMIEPEDKMVTGLVIDASDNLLETHTELAQEILGTIKWAEYKVGDAYNQVVLRVLKGHLNYTGRNQSTPLCAAPGTIFELPNLPLESALAVKRKGLSAVTVIDAGIDSHLSVGDLLIGLDDLEFHLECLNAIKPELTTERAAHLDEVERCTSRMRSIRGQIALRMLRATGSLECNPVILSADPMY